MKCNDKYITSTFCLRYASGNEWRQMAVHFCELFLNENENKNSSKIWLTFVSQKSFILI
jgi:hypothetical protein